MQGWASSWNNLKTTSRWSKLPMQHLQNIWNSLLDLQVLLSEVSPPKLQQMGQIDAWIQIACPRLSIDWGEGFSKPTLTPYEALVALGEVCSCYPSNAFARDSSLSVVEAVDVHGPVQYMLDSMQCSKMSGCLVRKYCCPS